MTTTQSLGREPATAERTVLLELVLQHTLETPGDVRGIASQPRNRVAKTRAVHVRGQAAGTRDLIDRQAGLIDRQPLEGGVPIEVGFGAVIS